MKGFYKMSKENLCNNKIHSLYEHFKIDHLLSIDRKRCIFHRAVECSQCNECNTIHEKRKLEDFIKI